MSFQIESLESREMMSAAAPNIALSRSRVIFSQAQNTISAAQYVTLRNTGTATLNLNSLALTGPDAADFTLRRKGLPTTLPKGQSIDLKFAFVPKSAKVSGATLNINTNDADTPVASVTLRGLGTAGRFDTLEPSLQRILDTFQLPVNVGDTDPATSKLDGPAASDEQAMQLLKKAGPGLVKISPLAAFSWDSNPVATVAWYRAKGTLTTNKLFSINEGFEQTVLPQTTGLTSFDPGTVTFGIATNWPSEVHQNVYSEDRLNTWDTTEDHKHKIRFYPYKNSSGRAIPNTYVMAIEEAFNHDFQDGVFIIENVMPYNAVIPPTNLVATPKSSSAIDLSWTDNNSYETSYVIERSTKKTGTYSVVGSVGANVAVFHDTGLTAGKSYYYRIRAVGPANTSDPSNRAVAST